MMPAPKGAPAPSSTTLTAAAPRSRRTSGGSTSTAPSTRSRRKTKATEPRTLHVTTTKGEFRITIPGDAKITYGPLFTSTSRGGDRYDRQAMPATLRIYEGTIPIACFTDVVTYRDMALPLERKVAAVKEQALWEDDGQHFRSERTGHRATKWLPAGGESDDSL